MQILGLFLGMWFVLFIGFLVHGLSKQALPRLEPSPAPTRRRKSNRYAVTPDPEPAQQPRPLVQVLILPQDEFCPF